MSHWVTPPLASPAELPPGAALQSRPTVRVARVATQAVQKLKGCMWLGDTISQLDWSGRRLVERPGVSEQSELLMYFHALGRDHVDTALFFARPGPVVEEGR
jgi:hypothetical protein